MNEIKTKETKETKETKNVKDKYTFSINNEIYDLTNFVPLHPGGADMFNCLKPGSNITSMIYSYHKDPKKILDILPKYKIVSPNSNSLNLLQSNVVYTYDNYLELKNLVYDEIYEKKNTILLVHR
jgi:cytochrome b involved in lipid metabolism